MSLRNISIIKRSIIGVIFVSIGLSALGLAPVLKTQEVALQKQQIERLWLPRLNLLSSIDGHLSSLDRSNSASLEPQRAELDKDFSEYQKLSTPNEQTKLERLHEQQRAYLQQLQRILSPERPPSVQDWRDLQAQRIEMNQSIEVLRSDTLLGLTATTQHIDTALHTSVVLAIVTLSMILITAWLLTSTIISPLFQAIKTASMLAKGDLDHPIEISGDDEITRLLESLQTLQNDLKASIRLISNSSYQLAASAEELSRLTEEEQNNLASHDQETRHASLAIAAVSLSLEEIAANASGTSDETQAANALAVQGKLQLSRTITAVDSLSAEITSASQTIAELANSSNSINQLLEVIRSISEQTNLLALNAAIEAARAGEMGRGFSVVADEVRALALRTQDSTRGIESMVLAILDGTRTSVEAMHRSKALTKNTLEEAGFADKALEQISEAISAINVRNREIAKTSQAQAGAVKAAEKSLASSQELMHLCAAGAAQSSSSSRELAILATKLKTETERFRL